MWFDYIFIIVLVMGWYDVGNKIMLVGLFLVFDFVFKLVL